MLLVVSVPLALVAVLAFAFGPPGRVALGRATGYGAEVLTLIAGCEPAQQRLGAPLAFSLLGGGLGGNYESGAEAGEGLAYGRLVVEGPSGSGEVEYQLSKQGGHWVPTVLVLAFPDGQRLDVKACARELLEQRQATAGEAWIEAQCEAGRADLCVAAARLAIVRGNAPGAARLFKKACDLGDREACTSKPP